MIPLGVDLVKDSQYKVRSIQAKPVSVQSRQKKYADQINFPHTLLKPHNPIRLWDT